MLFISNPRPVDCATECDEEERKPDNFTERWDITVIIYFASFLCTYGKMQYYDVVFDISKSLKICFWASAEPLNLKPSYLSLSWFWRLNLDGGLVWYRSGNRSWKVGRDRWGGKVENGEDALVTVSDFFIKEKASLKLNKSISIFLINAFKVKKKLTDFLKKYFPSW